MPQEGTLPAEGATGKEFYEKDGRIARIAGREAEAMGLVLKAVPGAVGWQQAVEERGQGSWDWTANGPLPGNHQVRPTPVREGADPRPLHTCQNRPLRDHSGPKNRDKSSQVPLG